MLSAGGVVEEAAVMLGGIPGWLVYFGKRYLERRESPVSALETAAKLATGELSKLPRRDRLVLEAIAAGERTWSGVRRYVRRKAGATIPKSTLTRIVRRLEKLSIIENYQFLDPVYEAAARRLAEKRRR